MEGYRSGHNGAVLKTVRAKAHGGSNPSPSASSLPARLRSVSADGLCPLAKTTLRLAVVRFKTEPTALGFGFVFLGRFMLKSASCEFDYRAFLCCFWAVILFFDALMDLGCGESVQRAVGPCL